MLDNICLQTRSRLVSAIISLHIVMCNFDRLLQKLRQLCAIHGNCYVEQLEQRLEMLGAYKSRWFLTVQRRRNPTTQSRNRAQTHHHTLSSTITEKGHHLPRIEAALAPPGICQSQDARATRD
ncbi:hypothetical protein GPALN_011743 [Globodera pallida]|nr:hypothetical protein GPALN_011743 [Globodera pallida]